MDFVLSGANLLCAGALGKSNRLHAPGGVVLDSLVAEKADHDPSPDSNSGFCRSGYRHGVSRGLVGALPSGYQPRTVYLSQPDRANTRREPRCLVLPEQNLLAVRPYVYLSEMEHLTSEFDQLHLVA